VNDARAGGGIRLRGAHVHAAVHLRRIHAHDLDREVPCQLEGDGGLAARGRPEEEDRFRTPSLALSSALA
jgi:hypothetical protein